MSAALNGLGNQLLSWLGPLSIELAALALLVLAADRLVESPALRHLLWLAVLVKPLIAMAVSSPYTVFAPLAPLAEPGWDPIPHVRVEHLAVLPPAGATTAPGSATMTPAGWAALLWLVGATLLAGRILVGFGILRRIRRQAHVHRDGPLFEALRRARAALDCHPGVEVATSPSIRSPMVLGILRPLIVIPCDLVDRLRTDELRLVLMHELAHVRRWDNLALLLQRLVTAALFFHPAVWLCGRMMRREAERACDDLVVCATGRPEAYARGLTQVAEEAAHSNPRTRRIPVMSTFAATESDLSQRIRRALNGQASRMRTRARLLAVGLLCPMAAVTLPSYGAADNGAGGEPAAATVAADSTLAEGTPGEAATTDRDEVLTFKELTERMGQGQLALRFSADSEGVAKVAVRAGTPKPDLVEAIARAMGVEAISEETIERVTAEDGGLTTEEKLLRIGEAILEIHLLQKAVATDPDEWSDGLKAELLLRPESTIEEIAQAVRYVRGQDRTKRAGLFVVVDQEGKMKLNDDKPVTLDTLAEELKKQRSLLDSTSTIIIQVHPDGPRAPVRKIMDIAREAGLVDQVIAMEPQPGR